MNFRKIAALLLALMMLLSAVGCANTAVKTDDEPAAPAESSEPAETTPDSAAHFVNDVAAYATHKPDDVILTIGGREYKWDIYFYTVYYYLNYLMSVDGTFSAWDAEIVPGKTTAQYVKESTERWFICDAAFRDAADRLGVSADADVLEGQYQQVVDSYGSEEALKKDMEACYCNKEMYLYLCESNVLSQLVFAEMYGDYGSELPDEKVYERFKDDGYMMAKHILLLNSKTDADGNTIELSEDNKAARLKQLHDIREELLALPADQVEAKFDEYMGSLSEDTGLTMFPNGYLFVHGEMVTEFEEAVLGVGENELTDVVETSYGYHLIYRLPVSYDEVPSMYSSQLASGQYYYTLRYLAARDTYEKDLENWEAAEKVEYPDFYEGMDFAKIFAF